MFLLPVSTMLSHILFRKFAFLVFFPRYSNHFPLTFSITKFTYEVPKLLLLFQKLFILTMKKKLFQWWGQTFENAMLKAENLQNVWDHYIDLFKVAYPWFIQTVNGQNNFKYMYVFNLLLEASTYISNALEQLNQQLEPIIGK